MSTSLQPREVDRPFLRRWCLAALALLLRAPLSFGLVIAVLGSLDTCAVSLEHGQVMARWPAKILTIFISGLLPAVWVVVAALARGADRSLAAGESLEPLTRRGLWRGVLLAVCVQIGQDLAGWALTGLPMSSIALSKGFGPGWFVAAVATYAFLLTLFFGSCYFPLLVQAPGVPAGELRQLSCRADELNGYPFLPGLYRERRLVLSIAYVFVSGVMVLTVALSQIVPAFGMTTAATLVFLGVFNYVSYRDIFERRAQNAPLVAARSAAAGAALSASNPAQAR